MKAKNCLIFGGSGQIGSFLIRKLTKNNIKVTVVTRNAHQKGLKIKTQGNAGYIDVKEANIFEEKKIETLFKDADFCINLIGILYEKKSGNTFKNIHTVFPTILAKLCKKYNLKNFIHVSALGINEATDSKYAISKLHGENNILNKLPTSASNLYAKNVFNFVSNLYDKENKKININLEDEIIEKTLIK